MEHNEINAFWDNAECLIYKSAHSIFFDPIVLKTRYIANFAC